MTLKYSVQPSTLSPSSGGAPIGRYQVFYLSQNFLQLELQGDSVLLSIATALSQGKPVLIVDSSGSNVATLLPSITGSTVLATPETPTPTQVNIGMRPSRQLLNQLRPMCTFEKLDTVVVTPSITQVTINVTGRANPYINEYPVGSSSDGLITIQGENLNKDYVDTCELYWAHWDSSPQQGFSGLQVLSQTSKQIKALTNFVVDPLTPVWDTTGTMRVNFVNGQMADITVTYVEGL